MARGSAGEGADNTPSAALRHYVDPTDTAFTQAMGWVPDGANCGALEAQMAARAGANVFKRDKTGAAEVPENVLSCSITSDSVRLIIILQS